MCERSKARKGSMVRRGISHLSEVPSGDEDSFLWQGLVAVAQRPLLCMEKPL